MQNKSFEALYYIQKDAAEAAKCAQAIGDKVAECKYLDQLNDASTELFRRKNTK